MVSYELRLERLGYKPECARRIVSDFTSTGKSKIWLITSSIKEQEKLSISEHVTDILG